MEMKYLVFVFLAWFAAERAALIKVATDNGGRGKWVMGLVFCLSFLAAAWQGAQIIKSWQLF